MFGPKIRSGRFFFFERLSVSGVTVIPETKPDLIMTRVSQGEINAKLEMVITTSSS